MGTKGKRQKPFIRWFRLLRAPAKPVWRRCGGRFCCCNVSLWFQGAPLRLLPGSSVCFSAGGDFGCRSSASTEPPRRVRPVLSRLRSRRSPALLPQTSGRESASARRLRRCSRLPERLLRELGPDRTEPRWSYLRVEQPSRRTELAKPKEPEEPETPGRFLSRAGAGLNTTSGVKAADWADPPSRHFPRAAPSVIGRRADSVLHLRGSAGYCGVKERRCGGSLAEKHPDGGRTTLEMHPHSVGAILFLFAKEGAGTACDVTSRPARAAAG